MSGDLESVLDDLDTSDEARQKAALDSIRRLEPEDVPRVVEIAREAGGSWPTYRSAAYLRAAGIVLLGLSAIAMVSLKPAMAILFLLSGVGCLVSAQGADEAVATARQLYATKQRRAERATKILSQLDDVRLLPALLETSFEPELGFLIEYTPPVAAALTRILPRLTPEGSANLTEGHRQRMRFSIQSYEALIRPDFVIEMLHALERLGDARAAPHVRLLAHAAVASPNSFRAREEARRLLPFFEDLNRKDKAANTLLRPATGLDSAQVLLRPARGAVEQDSQQLLRPAD